MNRLIALIFSLFAVSGTIELQAQNNRQQVMEEKVFEPQFRSIVIYPEGTLPQARLEPPVMALNGGRRLVLEFDELANVFDNYFVSFVHCNRDWTPSGLFDMDILDVFNEFPIRDYRFSRNTMVNYVSYRFAIPQLKRSGNYLVQVYRERDKKQMVLTRRMVVTENMVGVAGRVTFSEGVEQRNTHQQVAFTIQHPAFDLNNPMQEVNVVVKQNLRWDNARTDLKPFRIDAGRRVLDYGNFDLRNNFPGGNEFRFFDTRTLAVQGQNVVKLERDPNFMIAVIGRDRPRSGVAYSETLDLNGNFLFENRDPGNATRDPDYVLAEFFLESPKIEGKVILMGALTDYGRFEEAEMQHDAQAGGYTTSVFVKQGWHDYKYEVIGANQLPFILEGTFFETENLYEIIVYYRPIGERGDRVIGYQKLEANRRRN